MTNKYNDDGREKVGDRQHKKQEFNHKGFGENVFGESFVGEEF